MDRGPLLKIVGGVVVKHGQAVNKYQFSEYRPVGTVYESVNRLDEIQVDEICVLNTTASERPSLDLDAFKLNSIRTPLTFGGGIDTAEKALEVVKQGAERIVISPKTFLSKDFPRMVAALGEQAIVVHLPIEFLNFADQNFIAGNFVDEVVGSVCTHGFMGEFLVTAKSSEGTGEFSPGHANSIRAEIPERVNVLYSGGATTHEDVAVLDKLGFNGVVLGNVLNSRELFVPFLKANLKGIARPLEDFE